MTAKLLILDGIFRSSTAVLFCFAYLMQSVQHIDPQW